MSEGFKRLVTFRFRGRWRWLAATGGVLGIVAGVWLVVDYVQSIPPDPRTTEMDGLVDYVMRDDFNQLPENQRRKYTQQMVERFYEMTPQQRARIEDRVKAYRRENPKQMREQRIRFWKDFIVNEGQQYIQLPTEQRQAYLQQKLNTWETFLGGRKAIAKAARRHKPWPLARTTEEHRKAHDFYLKEVLSRTTATDRAVLVVMIRDINEIYDQ